MESNKQNRITQKDVDKFIDDYYKKGIKGELKFHDVVMTIVEKQNNKNRFDYVYITTEYRNIEKNIFECVKITDKYLRGLKVKIFKDEKEINVNTNSLFETIFDTFISCNIGDEIIIDGEKRSKENVVIIIKKVNKKLIQEKTKQLLKLKKDKDFKEEIYNRFNLECMDLLKTEKKVDDLSLEELKDFIATHKENRFNSIKIGDIKIWLKNISSQIAIETDFRVQNINKQKYLKELENQVISSDEVHIFTLFENPLGSTNTLFENPLGSTNTLFENPLGSTNTLLDSMNTNKIDKKDWKEIASREYINKNQQKIKDAFDKFSKYLEEGFQIKTVEMNSFKYETYIKEVNGVISEKIRIIIELDSGEDSDDSEMSDDDNKEIRDDIEKENKSFNMHDALYTAFTEFQNIKKNMPTDEINNSLEPCILSMKLYDYIGNIDITSLILKYVCNKVVYK
jgi:hypothetical protein